jgi:hypothetical protein
MYICTHNPPTITPLHTHESTAAGASTQLPPRLALLAATALLLLQNQDQQPQAQTQARAILEPLVPRYREVLPAAARAQFVAACALAGVRLPVGEVSLAAEVGGWVGGWVLCLGFGCCWVVPPYIINQSTTHIHKQEQPPAPSSDGQHDDGASDSVAHHALAALAHEHLFSSSSSSLPIDQEQTSSNPHAGLSWALHAHPASLRLQALLAHRVGAARARDGWAAVAGAG